MAEETLQEEAVEIKNMNPEERAIEWEKWVAGEVNAALGVYLPISKTGNIGVKYIEHVIEETEAGPQTDPSRADGVILSVYFEFDKTIDITKPRK